MKSISLRKVLRATLLALVLSVVMISMTVLSVATQTNSGTTVYLNPSTINGTVIGQEFTVGVYISDAVEISGWMIGLLFNPNFLECTGYSEGEFLANAGPT